MIRLRRSLRSGAALLAIGGTTAAHPLHTATLTLAYSPTDHRLSGTLRIFTADVAGATAADSASLARYLAPRVAFTDDRGAAQQVRIGRPGRDADVTVVPITVERVASTAGLRARLAVLQERFSDQVNVLRIKRTGSESSVLFLGGDGAKAIP